MSNKAAMPEDKEQGQMELLLVILFSMLVPQDRRAGWLEFGSNLVGVTFQIIVQEEEEERLGIPLPWTVVLNGTSR